MAGERNREAQLPRPHIIERPRLTRLLDQATAKVILLVAPAGYGKTTLAREWTRSRDHAWYQGNPSSRDVASFALGLAEAFGGSESDVHQRIRSHLLIPSQRATDVSTLIELLRPALNSRADSFVVVVDDYDMLSPSDECERLIWDLVESTPVRLLATARSRPVWATARRVLYGDVSELNQSVLAMDPEEASKVLSQRQGELLPGLAILAQGWPAVLGLAALTEDVPPAEGLPDELYNFFAEELYQQVPSRLRESLVKLAFVGSLNDRAVEVLLRRDATEIVAVASRIGFLSVRGQDDYSVHPLVRAFLEQKAEMNAFIAQEVAQALIDERYWDDAFTVIERFSLRGLFERLVIEALPAMARTGRLATLERWSQLGKSFGDFPASDVAGAEVALRRSSYQTAETLAVRASEQLPETHPLQARALLMAGQAAHLVDGEERAYEYHSRARDVALSEDVRRDAIWGQLISANQLDLPVVGSLVTELEAWPRSSPEDGLRLATMKGVIGLRDAGIVEALRSLQAAFPLLVEGQDPLTRTSFLNVFARCLAHAGFYEEATTTADALLTDAQDHRLDFVVPHALVAKAMAEGGARRPAHAFELLDNAEAAARAGSDLHNQVDAQALRCRLNLATRRYRAALQATVVAPDGAGHGLRSEFLLSRALALLAVDRADEATALRDEALQSGRSRKAQEVQSLARWVDAIIAMREGDNARLVSALRDAIKTGMLDSFVVTYRSFPEVLELLVADSEGSALVVPILNRIGDHHQARAAGLSNEDTPTSTLTPREREVYELLAAGRTNREIATALFISEVTVKVHVRHILQKLGARTRTEAVFRGARQMLPY